MEALGTRTVQGLGDTHSATSCAVPFFAGNPGMYQQSSFQVINLFSSEWLFLRPCFFFAVVPQFSALINNLIATTDRFIMGSRTASALSAQSSSQGGEPRISVDPLAWSMALRASRDISIQASIEYVVSLPTFISFICLILRIGRSREYIDLMDEPIPTNYSPLGYWRNLWSSLDFADQPLKSCVNIIHFDIVEIWNLCDKTKVSSQSLAVLITQPNQYLSNNQFKINMSHIVKELAVSAGGASSR